jgi:hypothetical protein
VGVGRERPPEHESVQGAMEKALSRGRWELSPCKELVLGRRKGTNMYEDRVLAFIDVLGFSEMVKRTIKDGVEVENETEKIGALFNDFQELVHRPVSSSNDSSQTSKIVNHFSDSIVISYLKTEKSGIFHILVDILFLCATVLQRGFLLRGAIVCGKLYHTETKIYGPALVKAYEMERKIAVYPRIILDDNILDIAKEYPRDIYYKNMEFKTIEKMILKDFDGFYFINYFDLTKIDMIDKNEGVPEYFELLRNKIVNTEIEDNPGVKSKYLWLKGKLPLVLKRYKRIFYNNKTKEGFPKLYDYIKNLVELEKKECKDT